MADKATARPDGGLPDIREAVQSLVDALNNSGKAGLSHSGKIVTVALTTSNTEVFHGLDRVPSYAWSVLQNAAGSVYSDTPHADPRRYINLKSSVPLTANVLIA